MRKRRLGRTGLLVSEISLGGVAFWWLNREDCERLLNFCLDNGVNYVDVYQGSGEKIRSVLKARRREFCLSTRGDPEKIDDLLKEFGIDCIDIFQITMVDHIDHYKAALDKLASVEKAKQAGKVRFFGIGTHSPALYEKIASEAVVDTILLPFNFVEDELLSTAMDTAIANDVGILVMKPLAGGNIEWATPALKWILRYPVASAVVGMASVEEAAEDIAVARSKVKLNRREEEYLSKERDRLGKNFCRMCGHCIYPDPCLRGINVRTIMMGNVLAMQTRRQTIPEAELAKVDDCEKCRQCEERCPWHLPISELLPERVREYRRLIKEMSEGRFVKKPVLKSEPD